MAPKNTGNASGSQAKGDSQSDATSQMDASQSQDIDVGQLKAALDQHKQQVKKRKEDRREAVINAHTARVKELNSMVDKAFAKHENAVRAARGPKVKRLVTLVRQRRELEDKAEVCVAQLDALFATTLDKFQIAVDSRLETVPA
ncbi:hypothetical protein LTR08_007521 [Meristemomyces frigidus]|nr:hypothetical protein LTR08_007521 [Meristemomyces frigidus]